jgi:hypothetical protein
VTVADLFETVERAPKIGDAFVESPLRDARLPIPMYDFASPTTSSAR